MKLAGRITGRVRRWKLGDGRALARRVTRLCGLTGLRVRHAARPLCLELDANRARLGDLSDQIEERFVACGRALQEQVKITSQLQEQNRQLRDFGERAESGETAIRRVSALITTHLAHSEELVGELDRLASTLEDHAGKLHELARDQQQIERSFAPMRVLHSYLRIESAGLASELQTVFHAVTAEMQRLHLDVAASFATQGEKLAETRRRVAATAERLRAQASRHAELTRSKRAGVRQALGRLDEELAETRERNRQLQSAIAELDRETDAMTVSLQYQDITRQKIEHVQTAAQDVLEQFARPSASGPRHARLQRVLCQVQSAQLGSVREELERATETIASGLRALLDRLQWIERECLSLEGLRHVTADMDTMTAEMIEAHRLSAGLMRDSLASLTEAIHTAAGFAEATTGATDTMQRIAFDLHVMGLNAQVQAVQANNGSLEVLAGAAAAISSEAGGLTLAFQSRLAGTTEALAGLIHGSRQIHDTTARRCAELQSQDDAIVRQLTEERAAGRALVENVGALLGQLKEQADALLGSLDLAEFSRAAIESARASFDALADVCLVAPDADASGDEAILAEVRSRYTMNSERTAHASVLRGGRAAEPDVSPASGGNSELFGTPTATAPGAAFGANVELF